MWFPIVLVGVQVFSGFNKLSGLPLSKTPKLVGTFILKLYISYSLSFNELKSPNFNFDSLLNSFIFFSKSILPTIFISSKFLQILLGLPFNGIRYLPSSVISKEVVLISLSFIEDFVGETFQFSFHLLSLLNV